MYARFNLDVIFSGLLPANAINIFRSNPAFIFPFETSDPMALQADVYE